MFSRLTDIVREQTRPGKQTVQHNTRQGGLDRFWSFYSVLFVCGSQEISVRVISTYFERILMMKVHSSYTEKFCLVS